MIHIDIEHVSIGSGRNACDENLTYRSFRFRYLFLSERIFRLQSMHSFSSDRSLQFITIWNTKASANYFFSIIPTNTSNIYACILAYGIYR